MPVSVAHGRRWLLAGGACLGLSVALGVIAALITPRSPGGASFDASPASAPAVPSTIAELIVSTPEPAKDDTSHDKNDPSTTGEAATHRLASWDHDDDDTDLAAQRSSR